MTLPSWTVPPLPSPSAPRVVTIGGGHGQAALLRALSQLSCEITAVVSVADDGGCSGRLREELGMPPPGDIRRCLVALSRRSELARRFGDRLPRELDRGPESATRSVGNLVLAELFRMKGSLQRAVDSAALLLGCVGRVVPVAESAGVLRVYDSQHGALSGESYIAARTASPIVVNVEGPTAASVEAMTAIRSADLVLMGPGSFVGSTLAALMTGDLARAVVETRARRVLIHNLEREPNASYGMEEHERILHDHLLIKCGGDIAAIDALSHTPSAHRADGQSDGSTHYASCLARPGEHVHDESLLATAFREHFGLAPVGPRRPLEADDEALAIFEAALAAARRRWHAGCDVPGDS